MNKNKLHYIISAFVLVASVAILLVFLLLPKPAAVTIVPLNVRVDDIQLEIGETITDFYQLSHQEATVEFSLDQENVINIDETRIEAIGAGRVNVEMTVTLGDNSLSKTFEVVVIANEYKMEFNVESGGRIEGDCIYLSSSSCQFTVQFYDKLNNLIEDCEISATATNDAIIEYRFGRYRITATTDCMLTFEVTAFNFIKTLNIICE